VVREMSLAEARNLIVRVIRERMAGQPDPLLGEKMALAAESLKSGSEIWEARSTHLDCFLAGTSLVWLDPERGNFLQHHRSLLALALRLRPDLIRASRVLPSMPPLFQGVERHFFDGQFGGFAVSGTAPTLETSSR
jgi:hypothetical protein